VSKRRIDGAAELGAATWRIQSEWFSVRQLDRCRLVVEFPELDVVFP
jgi:hypothetical protein